ncbi:MAG: TonB-dependent receptor [Chitinophagaceae bacterium]|nr:TonB-dependent receptor [Chitinophagaceae bacterium]
MKKQLLPLPKFFFGITLFLIASVSKAQDIPVTIKVINHKKEPVTFATVIVTNHADSNQVFKKVADSSGKAVFQLKKNGQYAVSITSVNYQPIEKGIIVSGGQTVFSFTTEPLPKSMQGVVVTSKKPLMRQEDDKTIVDPEPIAATSTNGYEIIEKIPGLFVDQDGNIYISSLTPAAVQINGRDMKMSPEDMATLLKNLPPNAIAKIEIVRTPSAKYDASGSGGVVNVVLKKGVKLGMTGSITGGMQQGTYGNQFLGFNLNNNDGKRSSNINISVGNRNNYERIKTDRFFAPDSVLQQDAYTRYMSKNIYASYSTTWQLSKKWEFTYDGDISYNKYDNRSHNTNGINKISTAQQLSYSLNNVNNDGYTLSIGSGFETKYKIDSTGSEWTNDFYFTHSIGRADQVFQTSYFFPAFPEGRGDGTIDNDRDYFTGRSDLKLKMKDKFTFESGVQVTINSFRNYTAYFNETSGVRTKDPGRTNTFRSNTNVNSLYLQGSKTFGDNFILKFGTRLENTNMKGQQLVPGDTSFSIQRTDLFPYVYLSKALMKIAGFELRGYLVYRRTISRPSYTQLNPFRRYVDQFLTEAGNPSLRPQFTNNYEFNISVDETPLLAVGINDTKDIFTNVVYQSDTSQSQALRTFDNVGKNKEWYLRGLGALPPGGKYFFVFGAQYNHNFYRGLYENKPLSFKKGTWTLFTYHSLKLDKRSNFTMNGFIRFKGQQQFYELSSFGQLSSSINRKFFKDKLTVTLSMNDIFYTNKNDFTIKQGSVNASGYRQGDTRRFGINLRYNFGIRKKEENNNSIQTEVPNN